MAGRSQCSLSRSPEGAAGRGQAAVNILADCGISRDDATRVREVLRYIEAGAVDAYLSGWG